MYLTRHNASTGPRWALDGRYLPASLRLSLLMELQEEALHRVLGSLPTSGAADDPLLPPVEEDQEVWASGVTYMRSREARMAESDVRDVYDKVYDAPRPELFFKALGHRVVGDGGTIRVRTDSLWNVPEPELVVLANQRGQIVGYTVGNDVSSRDIEGANPLYLPQAKVYDGSCALGPGIIIVNEPEEMRNLPISLSIARGEKNLFEASASVAQLKRPLEELVSYLTREIRFPTGVFLMTGTGIVPSDEFSLASGDQVRISVGSLTLRNQVE